MTYGTFFYNQFSRFCEATFSQTSTDTQIAMKSKMQVFNYNRKSFSPQNVLNQYCIWWSRKELLEHNSLI